MKKLKEQLLEAKKKEEGYAIYLKNDKQGIRVFWANKKRNTNLIIAYGEHTPEFAEKYREDKRMRLSDAFSFKTENINEMIQFLQENNFEKI